MDLLVFFVSELAALTVHAAFYMDAVVGVSAFKIIYQRQVTRLDCHSGNLVSE